MLEFLQSIFNNYEHFEKGSFMTLAKAERKAVNETFSDKYPSYLGLARPSESPKTKAYRKSFFEGTGNPVVGFYERFLSTFNVIFDSEEFEVLFGDDKDSPFHLERYLKDDYVNGDYIKSFKDRILVDLVKEPNGIYYVYTPERKENELPKPIVGFEPADNVLFYSETACFFRSSKKVKINNEIIPTGNIFYVYTNFHYVILTQKRGIGGMNKRIELSDYDITCKNVELVNGKVISIEPLEHYCPVMPVFLIGKNIEERSNERGNFYKSSYIKASLPFLHSAQFDWLNCETHKAYDCSGFMWMYGSVDCKPCDGKGHTRIGTTLETETCKSCSGSGKNVPTHSGDFGDVAMFSLENAGTLVGSEGNQKAVTPSQMFGRFDGDTTKATYYQKSFEDNLEKAYFTASMEVLGQVGETGSGTKKALDREEMTKANRSISELACGYLQSILTAIAYQRLYTATGEDIETWIPYVRTPTSFDNYTKVELTELIEKMDKGGFENSIIIKNQLRLAEREFGKQSPNYKRQLLQSKLDPLAGVTTDIRQQVMTSLTWEETVLSLRFNFIIEQCEKEEEANQTTCQIDARKKQITCKPKVNAFWLLSEAEQAERIKAKAAVLASATKENDGLVLVNRLNTNQQRLNNLETVQ